MLIILFGLAGSGKNFIGNILQEKFGYHFWDADASLTQEMQEYILNSKIFTQAMRDDFTNILTNQISVLSERYQNLVVSQALYKEKNRNEILKNFPDALFIHVKADQDIIFDRVEKRADLINKDYAKQMTASFETPLLPHKILLNNDIDEKELINHLASILKV